MKDWWLGYLFEQNVWLISNRNHLFKSHIICLFHKIIIYLVKPNNKYSSRSHSQAFTSGSLFFSSFLGPSSAGTAALIRELIEGLNVVKYWEFVFILKMIIMVLLIVIYLMIQIIKWWKHYKALSSTNCM